MPSSVTRGANAVPARTVRPAVQAATFRALPIVFEPNVGQAELPTRFIGRTGPLEIDLYPQGFTLRAGGKGKQPVDIKVNFVNCQADAGLTASEPKPSETNYLIGRDPAGWRTHVANFGRVNYTHLFPGIDAVFYGNGQQLEHDFVVAPGADYHLIRLRLRGSLGVSLAADGNLRLAVADGDLFFHKPIVYQNTGQARQNRRGSFVLLGNNEIGFEISNYDRSRPLCIDPSLTYSTYLANLNVGVYAVAADNSGNAYVTGQTFSASYPITPGAFESTCPACVAATAEIFITKVSPNGSGLVYSTFLGGSAYNEPSKIAVDANGDAVVTGWTESADFPLQNPISHGYTNGTGNTSGFITSLSPDGASLNYSSILGGGAVEYQSTTTYANGVALDSSGNAYVSGTTDSPVLVAAAGAVNWGTPAYPENIVFVSKISPVGSLAYAALLGDVSPNPPTGEGPFGVMGIAVDTAGAAYIAGAAGTQWPTTSGAYQPSFSGSVDNKAPFVAKLSADASTLVYSSFLGVDAYPTDIQVNGSGEAFVTGIYALSTFPTTSNAYQATVVPGSDGDAFFSVLDPTGSHLLYSSFFGHEGASTCAIRLDSAGNIWLAGSTGDPQFPAVNPIESTPPGINWATLEPYYMGFVSQLDPTGTTLLFSTFFGEANVGANIYGFALNSQGMAFIAGLTYGDFYTTPGAYLGTVTVPTAPNTTYSFGYVASFDAISTNVTLDPAPGNTLTFGGQLVGSTSTGQSVALTNSGTLPLAIGSIAASGDYAQTNTCGSSVNVQKSCQITVTFTPTAAGNQSGILTIADGAASSPQTLNLSGTGQDFTLGMASGASSTATVTAGQTATYSLTLSPLGGMNQTVDFTCASPPTGATCAVNPSSTTPSGAGAVPITVTVTTAARSLAVPPHTRLRPWGTDVASKGITLLLLGLLISVSIVIGLPDMKPEKNRLRFRLGIGALVAFALVMAACGGGSSGGGGETPPDTGTSTGTYTLTVTGVVSGLQHSTTLTLTVN